MFDTPFILAFFIGYCCVYGPPSGLSEIMTDFFHLYYKFFIYHNKLVYPGYWEDEEDDDSDGDDSDSEDLDEKIAPKYEDKYLDYIRNTCSEWEFNDEELQELALLTSNIFNEMTAEIKNRIADILKEINDLEKEIDDSNSMLNDTDSNSDDDEILTIKNKIIELKEEASTLETQLEFPLDREECLEKANSQAGDIIVKKRLTKLANSFVMEKVPGGNVLMLYDNEKELFKYYSDFTVPYRHLEVVARKYVKFFNCRPIYVDMEEELRLFEEKWEKQQEIKKVKEEEKRNSISQAPPKKNVFAKFKNYNKDTGKIAPVAPPRNSIPNRATMENKENEKVLLKERANRYAYGGKIVNFNFLQKVEKKVFNSKLGVSFAEFKKMNKT